MWGLPDPLPAIHDHHGVILILAVSEGGAVIVTDEGRLMFEDYVHLSLDWRFNWSTHTWEDSAIGEQHDETGDGSPEVPGDLPNIDGADRSDSGDEGDGETGSLDSK